MPARAGMPSRRTLIAGALWATPVIMGLTATPAFAASQPPAPAPPAPPTFSDVFEMAATNDLERRDGSLIAGENQLQVSSGKLRYIGQGTVSGVISLAAPPGMQAVLDYPSGGSFSLASGSIQSFGIRVYYSDWRTIPPGTYTLTATITMPGTTVTYTWTATK